MAGGVKGAKAPAQKPYVHQEYPKVLYNSEGKSVVVKSEAHEEKFIAASKDQWGECPADFLPEGHPDRPDTVVEDPESDGSDDPELAAELKAAEEALKREAKAKAVKAKAAAAKSA